MSESAIRTDNSVTPDPHAGAHSNQTKWSDIAAFVCSLIGLLLWLVAIPFQDPCQQGEGLAKFFAALMNAYVLGIGGGLATILLLAGLFLSLRARKKRCSALITIATSVSIVGIATGTLVLLIYLPPVLRILH